MRAERNFVSFDMLTHHVTLTQQPHQTGPRRKREEESLEVPDNLKWFLYLTIIYLLSRNQYSRPSENSLKAWRTHRSTESRLDDPGCNSVHANVFDRQVLREGFCETEKGCFCDRVRSDHLQRQVKEIENPPEIEFEFEYCI